MSRTFMSHLTQQCVSIFVVLLLVFSPVSSDIRMAEASTLYSPLTATSGTLPDGTTWNVAHSGFTLNIESDGDFDIDDTAGGVNNIVTITFSNPVNVTLTPTINDHALAWQLPGGAYDPSTAVTNGTDWVFAAGPSNPNISVVGDTATATIAAGIGTHLDWGTLQTEGATAITWDEPANGGFRPLISVTDTDADGVLDNVDPDDDNDGILDTVEGCGNIAQLVSNGDFSNGDVDWVYDRHPISGGIANHTLDANDSAQPDGFLRQSISGMSQGCENLTLSFDIWLDESTGYSHKAIQIYVGSFRAANVIVGGSTAGVTSSSVAPLGAVTSNITTLVDEAVNTVKLTIPYSSINTDTGDLFFRYVNCAGGGCGTGRPDSYLDNITLTTDATDTDSDGIADHLDLDSDNDGISDNVEAQPTAAYQAPAGDAASNGGVDSKYTGGLAPIETTVGTPDYLNLNSDGDTFTDLAESGLGNTDFTSMGQVDPGAVGINGLINTNESADDYMDVNGSVNNPVILQNTQIPGTAEVDYRELPSPGGVGGNLVLWLKADLGVGQAGDGTDVTTWDDSSSNSYDMSDAGTNPYIYREAGLNFNPTVDNPDGTNRRLQRTEALSAQTISIVTTPDNPDICDGPFGERAADDENIRVCAATGTQWHVPGNTADFSVGGQGWFNGGLAANPAHNNSPHVLTVEAAAMRNIVNGIELGDTMLNRFWHGDIAEVIGYGSTYAMTDRQKIESYLALKYGITLEPSVLTYKSSDSTDVYVYDGIYDNDILGIAKDSAGAFDQRASSSVNTGTILTVATTNDFTNPNKDTARTSLVDGQYIVFGSDQGALTLGTAELPTAIAKERVTREWKVENTNNVGDVYLQFTGFDDSVSLVHSTDPDFTVGTVTVLGQLSATGSVEATVPTGYVTLMDVLDDDGDGNPDSIEDAGNNGGDGNGDGIPDSEQQSVSGAPNPVTGDYTTLESAGASCTFITSNAMVEESGLAVSDPTYEYPVGLVDFQVECTNPGESADVVVYYGQIYDTSEWQWRKFNSVGEVYSDISSLVVYGTADLDGDMIDDVTTASFTVTDGDPETDEDGIANRFIVDPSGPAITGFVPAPPKTERVRRRPAPGEGRPVLATPEDSTVIPLIQQDTAGSYHICEPYLKEHIKYGDQNNPIEVNKLITFLNEKQGEQLMLDGTYDADDLAAVKRFQVKYSGEVLDIWGLIEPTGYVYKTTKLKINSFYCNQDLQCPVFNEYNKLTENNNTPEVAVTKGLLSGLGFYTGPINQSFDQQLHQSLINFQEEFHATMLDPWNLTQGTGYKYKTTNKFLNFLVGCDTPPVELDGRGVFDY